MTDKKEPIKLKLSDIQSMFDGDEISEPLYQRFNEIVDATKAGESIPDIVISIENDLEADEIETEDDEEETDGE